MNQSLIPVEEQSHFHDVASIVVGERRREDYGNVSDLAASMETYGLFHPVVIDEAHNLVAGGRRLAAARMLGWQTIPVRLLGTLTDAERREIELEENLQRKDLTSYELNRTLVDLAETAAEADKESFVRSSHETPGRPAKAGSLRRVSDRIGIPVKTIHDAQQHVATADTFPTFKTADWKQSQVMQAKEALDRLPEEERAAAVAVADDPHNSPHGVIDILNGIAQKPASERQEIYRLGSSDDPHDFDGCL